MDEASGEILRSGGQAESVTVDLGSPREIIAAVNKVSQKTKHIDVLANIAGMYHDDEKHFFGIPFEEYPDEAIINNVNSILVGHILMTKHLVPLMDKTSSVINMSGSFDEGETGVISDYITKKGVELFTKQLPLELKDRGVRVNAVSPDFVFTENVKKFFPDVTKEESLDPAFVASRIVEIVEDPTLNGQIVEIKRLRS